MPFLDAGYPILLPIVELLGKKKIVVVILLKVTQTVRIRKKMSALLLVILPMNDFFQ